MSTISNQKETLMSWKNVFNCLLDSIYSLHHCYNIWTSVRHNSIYIENRQRNNIVSNIALEHIQGIPKGYMYIMVFVFLRVILTWDGLFSALRSSFKFFLWLKNILYMFNSTLKNRLLTLFFFLINRYNVS